MMGNLRIGKECPKRTLRSGRSWGPRALQPRTLGTETTTADDTNMLISGTTGNIGIGLGAIDVDELGAPLVEFAELSVEERNFFVAECLRAFAEGGP